MLATLAAAVFAAVTATLGVKADLDAQGVAKVEVEITLRNSEPRETEYELLFPASPRAVLDSFRLTDADRPLTGKAYPAPEARRIYEEIVRRRKDPALLEYMGRALFRARVFPVPAGGEMRLRLRYAEPLEAGPDGLFQLRFPLAAESLDLRFSPAQAPPAVVFSPTHPLAPAGARAWRWKPAPGEERPAEVVMLYGFPRAAEPGSSIDARVLTYRPDPRRPGYFALLLTPRMERPPALGRFVTLLIDRSGSMAGAKWAQAKDAARRILASAAPGDLVRVILYSDQVETIPAEGALEAIEAAEASGGTNIGEALRVGLEARGAAPFEHAVIFLTDGLPTIGERDSDKIVRMLGERRIQGTRVFVLGLGHDVNGVLLDRIAAEGRGLAGYVRPQEDLAERVAALYDSIRSPVLADAALEVEGVRCFDVYPREQGDLFADRTVLVAGRYAAGAEKARVRLRGRVGVERRELSWDLAWPDVAEAGNAYVARIYANRRVGFLVDEVRLRGPSAEVIGEIVRLGTEFGVLTEYTSFLVEDGVDLANFAANNDRCAHELGSRTKRTTGSHGFSQAANTKKWQGEQQQRAANRWLNERGEEEEVRGVRQIAGKTFFRRGSGWVDAGLASETAAGTGTSGGTPATATAAPAREVLDVELFSPRYFEVVTALGDDARYLGAGREVVLVLGDKVYRVHEPQVHRNGESTGGSSR